MTKRVLTIIIATVMCSSAFAEKIYMGIFVTNSEFSQWVSLRDKPCSKSEENAVMMSGSIKKNGCWKLEDKKIKIDWADDSESSTYPLELFKLVGDTKFNSKTDVLPDVKSKVVRLNCQAADWVGDVIVERDADGSLKKVLVGAELVDSSEANGNINFSFKGLNIVLSTVTGMFNYSSTLMNNLLLKENRRGVGQCKIIDDLKKF